MCFVHSIVIVRTFFRRIFAYQPFNARAVHVFYLCLPPNRRLFALKRMRRRNYLCNPFVAFRAARILNEYHLSLNTGDYNQSNCQQSKQNFHCRALTRESICQNALKRATEKVSFATCLHKLLREIFAPGTHLEFQFVLRN